MKAEELESGDRTGVGSRTVTLGIGLFATIVMLIGFDVAADYRSGTERPHLLAEGIVMGACSCGLGRPMATAQIRTASRRTVDS